MAVSRLCIRPIPNSQSHAARLPCPMAIAYLNDDNAVTPVTSVTTWASDTLLNMPTQRGRRLLELRLFSEPASFLSQFLARFCENNPTDRERSGRFAALTSCFLVAPTGFEPATSALRGGSKPRNGQELTGTNGRLNWDYRVLTELGGITRKRSLFVGRPVIVPSLKGPLRWLLRRRKIARMAFCKYKTAYLEYESDAVNYYRKERNQ